jgi:hypothetical protein
MLLSSADHFVEIPQVTESLPGSLGNEAIKVERQDECDQGTKGLGSATSIWKHKKITETMKSLSLVIHMLRRIPSNKNASLPRILKWCNIPSILKKVLLEKT